MREYIDRKIRKPETLSLEEAQREDEAIHSLAVQHIRDKDRRRQRPRGRELTAQSVYLDYLKMANPDYRKYVIGEENLRQMLTDKGCPGLYKLWEKAWLKAKDSMRDLVAQAEEGKKSVRVSAQRNSRNHLTKRGRNEVKKRISQINQTLVVEAIDRMRKDEDLVTGFLGKERLLQQCFDLFKDHAMFTA